MITECDQFAFGFQPLKRREIRDEFDGGAISSDGGGLLLRELEKRTGMLRQHRCTDFRNPDLIAHTAEDMMPQRVYGLALGYEDLSDLAPFDEVLEHVLHFDMQALGQFLGEITLGGNAALRLRRWLAACCDERTRLLHETTVYQRRSGPSDAACSNKRDGNSL